MLCRLPGRYFSLCLNLDKDRIYKACGYCESLIEAMDEMAINVDDLWLTTELGRGAGVELDKEGGFSYHELETYYNIKNSLYQFTDCFVFTDCPGDIVQSRVQIWLTRINACNLRRFLILIDIKASFLFLCACLYLELIRFRGREKFQEISIAFDRKS